MAAYRSGTVYTFHGSGIRGAEGAGAGGNRGNRAEVSYDGISCGD